MFFYLNYSAAQVCDKCVCCFDLVLCIRGINKRDVLFLNHINVFFSFIVISQYCFAHGLNQYIPQSLYLLQYLNLKGNSLLQVQSKFLNVIKNSDCSHINDMTVVIFFVFMSLFSFACSG